MDADCPAFLSCSELSQCLILTDTKAVLANTSIARVLRPSLDEVNPRSTLQAVEGFVGQFLGSE